MKSLFASLFALCMIYTTHAQNVWTQLTWFGSSVLGMEVYDDKLFMVGNITDREGMDCNWTCIYDGSDFDDEKDFIAGGGLTRVAVHNGELFSVGSMQPSTFAGIGVYRYSNDEWVLDGDFNHNYSALYSSADGLYVGDAFGNVKLRDNSGSYTNLPSGTGSGADINAFAEFGGELIIAGTFDEYDSVTVNNICKWDGMTVTPFGSGADRTVTDMVIYKNELYICGKFDNVDGQPIVDIARYDGTNWKDVGGSGQGTLNGLSRMLVHDGLLYAVGDFQTIGGISANNLGVWDGTSWTDLGLPPEDDFGAKSLEFFQGSLYVGLGSFDTAYVYRYGPPTSIDEGKQNNPQFLYYDMDNKLLRITGNVSKASVSITDISGRSILSEPLIQNKELSLDGIAPGIYQISMESSIGTQEKKIVVY